MSFVVIRHAVGSHERPIGRYQLRILGHIRRAQLHDP